jgi:plasmid stabilization system protein ParE
MYKVTWRKSALVDGGSIVTYTKTKWGQIQAGKVVDLLEQTTEFLSESPKMGRRVHRKNTFALVLPKVPFVIVYQISGENVYVNQVIHTSRRR